MALNFGLLDQGGPTNFFEGYSQGQEKMQANALAQQRAAQAQQEFGMRQQEFAASQAEKKRLSTAAIVTQKTLAARNAILNARTPDDARAIERAQHADEYLGPIRRQFGSLEADLADIPDEPTAFQQWKEKQAMGAETFLKQQFSNREFASAMGGAPQANAMTAPAAAAPAPAPAAPPQTQLQSLVDQYDRFSRKPNPDKRDENRIKFLTEEISRLSKRNLHTVAGVGLVDADTNKIVYASQEKGTLLSQLQDDLAKATDPKVRKEIQARIDKEISHQPATSVTVSTEKTYGGKLADKLADRDDAKLGAAEKAPQLADSANRIISLVNQGNLFTGPIAGIKLNIARALNVAGASNEEKISNTESLIAATGQSTLDAIKGAGLGTGQGFTDKDLKFLQQIAGGTFELTPATLTKLATLQHQAAVRSVDSWNTRFTQIPKSATGALGLSTVPKIPPLVGASTSSGFKYLGKESN